MNGQDIYDMHTQMQNNRANFNNLWQETAMFAAPEYANFTTTLTQGLQRNLHLFDITAVRALDMYVSMNNTMLTPRNRQWHKITPANPSMKANPNISAWLEKKTKDLFSARYNPYANFAGQIDVFYKLDGLIGNSVLFVDDEKGKGIRYKNIHPKEIYIMPNHQGIVDHIHRAFSLTAKQAVEKFQDGDLPQKIKTDADDPKKQGTMYDFIHCVMVNPDYMPNSLRTEKRYFISYYMALNEKQIISTGGYRTMPYIYNRYMVAAGEDYGRGPAVSALPKIKIINEKQKTVLRAGQLAAEPPIMLGQMANVAPFSMRPGSLNFGYLLEDGREMAKPFNSGSRPDIADSLSEQDRDDINALFFVNLYQILSEQPNMTATEVMERTREKAQLLAPSIGRKQSEFLGPLITREIDILTNYGFFDDIPQELMQSPEPMEIIYDTEMTNALRADEGMGIIRTLETALQAASADPSVLDIFDLPSAMRELALINGMPSKLLRSPEMIKSIQEQRQQEQQMAQMAELANKAAPAAAVANKAGYL